jgi:hypothetical protein
MIEFIEGKEEDQKSVWTIQLIEALVITLENNLTDDRYAIPAMDISAFLLDSCLPLVVSGPVTRFVSTSTTTSKPCPLSI